MGRINGSRCKGIERTFRSYRKALFPDCFARSFHFCIQNPMRHEQLLLSPFLKYFLWSRSGNLPMMTMI